MSAIGRPTAFHARREQDTVHTDDLLPIRRPGLRAVASLLFLVNEAAIAVLLAAGHLVTRSLASPEAARPALRAVPTRSTGRTATSAE